MLSTSRPLWQELLELAASAALAAGLVLAAWGAVSPAPRAPASAALAPADLGRQLFQSKGCFACHSAPGFPTRDGPGPDLSVMRVEGATRRPPVTAVEHVRQSILDPAGFVRDGYVYGVQMPKLDVSERELEALVAFLLDARP